MKYLLLILSVAVFAFASCKKNVNPSAGGPSLIFKFKFDSTQQRLNNFGQPATLPAGHAAQSPVFHSMSAHYIELAPDSLTALGSGVKIYKAAETTAGGSTAIDFAQSTLAGNNEEFFRIALKDIAAGNYKWLRVSLAYQNYDIQIKYDNAVYPQFNGFYTSRLASFLGYNTYITKYKAKTNDIAVYGNRLQGYWGLEMEFPVVGIQTYTGQAPAGATTVPNPLAATSPIPAGSCVVTGKFSDPGLQITGNETGDIVITVSLSTNKSFEWMDTNGDGYYQPTDPNNLPTTETVVDMGIRGLIPFVQY